MKHYIIPNEGNFYKANLHCHSTLSDGKLTPEELKDVYKSAGYSVLAYSDHNVLIDHSDLDDEDFLTFTSVEINVTKSDERDSAYRPCYHLNFYPRDKHNTAMPCYDPMRISEKHADLRETQAYVGEIGYKREYEKINEMIDEYAKNGFIAMLNHPAWSLQSMEDYRTLDTTNIFAMEIYNHDCVVEGFNDVNEYVYDNLLRRGDKLFCTATDDNHNKAPVGSPLWDSLGGFVMIKAPDLTHKSIFEALEAGNFYASTAPEIHELYIEDGCLCVKTSPAAQIILTCEARQAKIAYPATVHTALTDASFDLTKIRPGYVRVTVIDDKGRKAWSQPIWCDYYVKK